MASIGDRNPFSLLSDPTTPTPSKRRKRCREASTSDQLVLPPASVESVKISPSKSACLETEVRVDVNLGNLITQMKREIMDEVNSWMDRADSRMNRADAQLNDHVAESSFMLRCGKYASLRSVEDWALNRIKRLAKLPSATPHRETIDFFLRNYEALGVPKEYLLSLRHSSVRQTAVNYVHMSPDDADAVDSMWNSLSRMLTTEERDKYRALLQFGRGLTSVRYVGGL